MSEAIIDAHHHIWRLAELPWLTGPPVKRIFGDYEKLKFDYLAQHFMADVVPQGVVKSVYIQVNVAPGKEVDEARWVQSEADRHGFPHAVAGFANLSDPNVAETLDRLAAGSNLKSIRQQLHWHENPQYRFAARPDTMNDPLWRNNLAAVAERGLVFDLQVFMGQAEHAENLVAAFPGLTFILTHAGMPEELTPDGMAHWRAGLARLAAHPNVAVKLSGFGTFIHCNDAAHVKTIVHETVQTFGPDRCLFGSNFPIEKLWTDYGSLLADHLAATEAYPTMARAAIFGGTATRLYRLDLP